MRLELVADRKKELKAIDAEGARIWDELEALQKEVRQPLTEWENRDKERIAMSEQVWASILAAIPDVEVWNANLSEFKRLTEQYGLDCRTFVRAEAERRGYIYSKDSKCYVHPWKMIACNHPGRLIGVGWRSGQLACVFASKNGPVRYESVSHEIPAQTAQKLVNSLYPDNLYNQLIKSKGVQMVKVG